MFLLFLVFILFMQIPQVPVLPLIKCSTTPLISLYTTRIWLEIEPRPSGLPYSVFFVFTEATRRALNNAEDSPLVFSANDSTVDPGASSIVMIGDKLKAQLHCVLATTSKWFSTKLDVTSPHSLMLMLMLMLTSLSRVPSNMTRL